MTNAKVLSNLVGEQSWIVHYLRGIGYDLGKIVQTGANFGGQVKHESPFLSSIGTGTMVADALSMMNAEYSTTTFRLSRTSIGKHNYLGNGIAYPPRSKPGDNRLLATKVMVPISGKVRENVGLLGSPAFEIPRSVDRDSSFDYLRRREEELQPPPCRQEQAQLRHHLVVPVHAMVLSLHDHRVHRQLLGTFTPHWVQQRLCWNSCLLLCSASRTGSWSNGSSQRFNPVRPCCSARSTSPRCGATNGIGKCPRAAYITVFVGTPFINMILRLVGSRIGRRVFNDGCAMTERSLVTIGDDCTLNETSSIQCH